MVPWKRTSQKILLPHERPVHLPSRLLGPSEHAQKKTGSRSGLPVGVVGVSSSLLEIDLQSELQSAHRRAESKARDVAGAAAIDAAIWAIKVNVVEDVVSVKLELRLKPFSDAKGLEHGEVRVEEFRSAEGVASHVSERLHGRLGP